MSEDANFEFGLHRIDHLKDRKNRNKPSTCRMNSVKMGCINKALGVFYFDNKSTIMNICSYLCIQTYQIQANATSCTHAHNCLFTTDEGI